MSVRSTTDTQLRNATLPASPRDDVSKNAETEREAELRKTPPGVGISPPTAPVDTVSTTPGVNPSSELVAGVGNLLASPFPPPAVVNENSQRNLGSYSANLDVALTGSEGKSAAAMSADELFATFMKLNAVNSSSDLQDENDLQEAASKLQQLAIENAKAAIKSAEENLKKAESEQGMFKNLMGMLEMMNPVYTICKACGMSKDILGYIDPIANACEPLANDNKSVDAAKADLESATKCLDELMTKSDWAKLAQLMAEYQAQQKAETGSADESGVPTKGLTAGLKGAATKAAAALAKISADQGFAAMIGATPAMIRDAVLPVLQANNVPNAELAATMLGIQVAMQLTAKAFANDPAEGMAVMTMMLGKMLENDGSTTGQKLPSASDATLAALDSLRVYTTETAATASQKRGSHT